MQFSAMRLWVAERIGWLRVRLETVFRGALEACGWRESRLHKLYEMRKKEEKILHAL